MFKNKSLRAAAKVGLGVLLLVALPLAARAATSVSTQQGVLSVTEVVANNGSVSLNASGVQLANIAGVRGCATGQAGLNITVGQYPWQPYSQGSTFSNNTQATDALGQYLKYGASTAAKIITNVLQNGTGRFKAALVTYVQNATIAGQPAEIDGSLWVNINGSYSFIGVHVNQSIQRILYAVYEQGAVKQGLPQGWVLPYAGELRWEILQVNLAGSSTTPAPVSINGSYWHTINYLHNGGPLGQYGEYDEPQVVTVNGQKRILNCKIGSDGRCDVFAPGQTAPYTINGNVVSYDPFVGRDQLVSTTFDSLMKQYNAQTGILDYGRTVQPVYNNGQAVLAVKVSSRTIYKGKRVFFIVNSGQSKFVNAGEYGYLLNESYNRGIVLQTQGTITSSQTLSRHTLSPTHNYSKTVYLGSGSVSQANYQYKIIDPFGGGNQVYDWRNDTVNHLPASDYIYVAPLQVK